MKPGWTQEALARRTGLSQSAISLWLRGEVEPRLAHYERLVAVLPAISAEDKKGTDANAPRTSPSRKRS